MKLKLPLLLFLFIVTGGALYAQAPTISYASPQNYPLNKAIVPLAPTGSGVAVPGYSSKPTILGYFITPTAVSLDAAGNIYVLVSGEGVIKKIPVGGGNPVPIDSGLYIPAGMAVDAAGNIYFSEQSSKTVKKIPVGGGGFVTLASGFNEPGALAVDAAGNVYVSDYNSYSAVKKIPVGGGTPIVIGPSFTEPDGIATDAYGNVYVDDFFGGITKITPGGITTAIVSSDLNQSAGIAVDASGNLFVADQRGNRVMEFPVGGGSPISIGSGYFWPSGVAIDAAGNVLVVNFSNAQLQRITPVGGFYISQALPEGLTFNNATGIISGTPVVTSPATNYTITAYNATGSSNTNINIAVKSPQTLTFPQLSAVTYGKADFAPGATSTNTTLPVVYTSSNTSVATITTVGNIHILGAGKATITATQAGNAVYLAASPVVQTLTVNPAPLTIAAVNQTKPYGAADPALTVAYSGFVNNDTQAVLTSLPLGSTAATNTSPLGTYPISVSGAAATNYAISYTAGTLTVNKANLTVTAVNQAKIYGSANPALSVTFSGFVNGDSQKILTSQPTVSTTALTTSAAGTYPIIPTGAVANANYTISYVSGTLTVNKAALTITALNQSKTYGAANPAFTAAYSGFVNGDTPASLTTQPVISTTATTASPVGAYPIIALGANAANYNISYLSGVLTVGKASLTVTAANQSKTYGAANPALTVNYSGFVNGDTPASFTTQPALSTLATTASPVGNYAITATGAASANYAITYSAGTLTINKAALTITAANQSKTFGSANPALTVAYSGFVNGDTPASLTSQPAISTTATPSSPFGTYPITATGAADPNYTFNYVAGTLTVTHTPFTFAVIPAKIYGAADFSPNAVSTSAITYSSSNVAVATIVSGNIHIIGAGTSTITASSGGSILTQILTVTPAALTITAVNQTKVYGSVNPALTVTYTGFVNGDTKNSLITQPTISTTALTSSPAGAYPIIATGAAGTNYTISYITGTLTVGKAALTITAVNQTKIYGAANPTLTATYSGLVNGDTQASLTVQPALSTTATAVSVAGAYPITVTGAVDANYAISYVAGALTVGKAPLTITALNQTKTYGAANPVLTTSYIGFVNGDTKASLSTQPTIITTALTTSAAGTYPVIAAGAFDANYNISYITGTLTVSPATLTVTVNNQGKTYGAVNPALTVTYTGFVNGDTQNIITKVPAISTTALATSPAGTYPVNATGAVTNANYTISYVAGTLTVNPATLTITAVNQTKTYGAANPPLTVTYSGFVNGDTQTSLTAQPAINTTATAASATGSYPITAAGASAANYNISYITGSLTIGKALLTITANSVSKLYGAVNPPLTFTYNGFVNGDTQYALITQPTLSTTATATSTVGTYPIMATGAAGANYTFNYVAGTLTVTLLPTVSYGGQQTYTAGVAITPLTPASSRVTAQSYSSTPVSLGSGYSDPYGVATDAAGNLYIADTFSNTIKKLPVGGGSVDTIGSGFNNPTGVAVDASGNVYVADFNNNAIKKVPAGGGATVTIGPAFGLPFAVAADAAGHVYVTSPYYGGVNEIPGGELPTGNGGFFHPRGVAVDPQGNLYVTDDGDSSVVKVSVDRRSKIILGSGFTAPWGVALDAAGNVYVSDNKSNEVKEIPVGGGGPISLGSGFKGPAGVAVDGAGNVYVADFGNDAIKKITPLGGFYISPALPAGLTFNTATGAISGTPEVASPATNYTITAYNGAGYATTVVTIAVNKAPLPQISYHGPQTYTINKAIIPLAPAGSGVAANGYSVTPVTLASAFGSTSGVATDLAGDVYVADALNNAVLKFPVGGGAPDTVTSAIYFPNAVATDAAGNVYVPDYSHAVIKKLPAGGGSPVNIPDPGINQSIGLAVDAAGDVYVTDQANNKVKKFPAAGGSPVIIGSGFNYPQSLAVDGLGNVYVANNNDTIQKIPYGGGSPVVIGTGLPYALNALTVDGAGNVFDVSYNGGLTQIQEIPAGGGTPFAIGPAVSSPNGLATDTKGNIYFTDYYNNNLEELSPIGGYYISPMLPAGLSFNNTTGVISGTPTALSPPKTYTITGYNSTGGSSTATVTIAVVSNNASLANLTLSSGTLSPVFAAATTAYTATVANAVSSLTVTPTTSDPTATVKINGTAVTSGTASASLPLAVGSNTLSTVVTAGDGKTTETYTITVTRTNSTNASLYVSDEAFQSSQFTSSVTDAKVVANNILSPNGDGVNDTWLVKNIENYPNNAVTVYDRSGHIVFTQKGYANDWAGTYHGSVLNEGTYYYLVDLGNGTSLKGFITVVRDR